MFMDVAQMSKKLILILLFLPGVLAVNLEFDYYSDKNIVVEELFTSSFKITNLEASREFVIIRELSPTEDVISFPGATIKYFDMEHYSNPYLEYLISPKTSEVFSVESKFKKLSVDGRNKLPEIHVLDKSNNLLYSLKGKEILIDCKKNNYCDLDLGENSLNCPQDCSTGMNDDYCDRIQDGICDPDCLTELDLDCEEGEGIIEIPLPKKLNMDARSLVGRGFGEFPEGRGGLVVFAVLVLVLIGYFVWKKRK